ncbi:MAG TPA: sugar transferase, partial [Solirubrobacterales bacterium]
LWSPAAANRPSCRRAAEANHGGNVNSPRSSLSSRDDPRYRRSLTIARKASSRNAFLSELPEAEPGLEELVAPAAEGDPRPIDPILRALDIFISASILLVLSPLLALIALAIALDSGRPVLYRGARVGKAGHLFWMYKFRTLKPDAETRLGPYYGEELTRRTEEERTRIGGVLRKTHLDEVPQLWNVLRGDMSVVGPRPIRPTFYAQLCREIPQYWQRLVVRPGVTGFAQTRITREETWADKLAHDMEYIADRSVSLYLQVLLATINKVLGRGPAVTPPPEP